MEESRFSQRFGQFEKTFLLLKETMEIKNPSIAENAGLIKFFEMAFELSWKVMKNYEEEREGFEAASPVKAIKRAYQSEIVSDGRAWLQALKDRNLTVHAYDEYTARQVDINIRNIYYPMMLELYTKLKRIIDDEEEQKCSD